MPELCYIDEEYAFAS